eukprot:scaffold700_cov560-Prasinococcus_capsulatus_cf.AAC.8
MEAERQQCPPPTRDEQRRGPLARAASPAKKTCPIRGCSTANASEGLAGGGSLPPSLVGGGPAPGTVARVHRRLFNGPLPSARR